MNKRIAWLQKQFMEILSSLNLNPTDGLKEAAHKLLLYVSKGSLSSYHALLQYAIASFLYKNYFDVWVERNHSGNIVSDIYAEHPTGRIIIEVETGFIPQECIKNPLEYLVTKFLYKASKYSAFSDKFFVALPEHIEVPTDIIDNKKLLKRSIKKCGYLFNWNHRKCDVFKINGILKIYLNPVRIDPVSLLYE